MATFTDGEGRRWSVRVSLGALRDLEEAAGFPVLAAIADRDRLREQILGRAEIVAQALYFAVREEAERRNVTQADFERSVSGPALGQACQAFFDALVECFPAPAGDLEAAASEEKQAARPTGESRGPGEPSTAWRRLATWLSRGLIR
jgi:hypothetical protein